MKRILVMDDEPAVRGMIQKLLERQGYSVMTAADGREGMALFKEAAVDLVVTDLIMPEKEGIEIIMELRKKYPDMPVIAMSGGGRNSPEYYLNTARLLGARAVLEKPVRTKIFLDAVEKALK